MNTNTVRLESRFTMVAITLLTSGLLSACAVLPVPPEPPPPRATPRPYTIALAPVTVRPGPGIVERGAVFRPAIEPLSISEGMAGALAGTFENVFTPAVRPGQDTIESILEAAARLKGDYLYQLDIQTYDITYGGTNSNYWASFLVQGILVVPGWYMGDEVYRANLTARLRVHTVATRELLDEHQIVLDTELVADEAVKGWTLAGTMVNWPGQLSDSHWRKLDDIVRPVLMGKLKIEVVAFEPKPLPPTSAALVVGVSDYNLADIPSVPVAEDDAARVRQHLLQRGGGPGVPPFLPQNVRFRPGGAATRAQVLQDIDDIADQVRDTDTVFVYFAGRAAVAPGPRGPVRYLLTWDADPADLKSTALDLKTLREHLDKIQAGTIVIVLDTSFASTPGAARAMSFLPEGTPAPPPLEPATLLTPAPGRAVWLASTAEQGARDFGRGGLFSTFMLQGAQGRADGNNDGQVTWAELAPWVAAEMQAVLAPERERQDPLLYPPDLPMDSGWLGGGKRR